MKPLKVRVSIGTASVLGLVKYKQIIPPTTAYLMSFTEGTCNANCAFCAQARENNSEKSLLSRVVWPEYKLEKVLTGLRNNYLGVLKRICFQVINYPGYVEDTLRILKDLNSIGLPISLDVFPVPKKTLKQFKAVGVEKISIPLDAATPEIFDNIKGRNVKGPYIWDKHLKSLKEAQVIFGKDNVGSNLIIGLGETEEEAVNLIQLLHNLEIKTILFAFTPIKGTKLENLNQPALDQYRRIQVARYLITNNYISKKDISFKEGKIANYGDIELNDVIRSGEVFQTTGCPGCNRPFYNERPSGPFYNYPRPLTKEEIMKEIHSLKV